MGKNEAIENFPVGRRLAFDAAKGRLWAVCRKCERWNLSPLEERWEAIEECERLFRSTRMRVSTDEIGLARLKEGLELVRIGEPQRPEMAAWRYGDQFGRRRRRMLMYGAGAVALGTAGTVAPLAFAFTGGALLGLTGSALSLANSAHTHYAQRKALRVRGRDGEALNVLLGFASMTTLQLEGGALRLDITVREPYDLSRSRLGAAFVVPGRRTFFADDAMQMAGVMLPILNKRAGSTSDIASAVARLEATPAAETLFRNAAETIHTSRRVHVFGRASGLLRMVPIDLRLALEMVVHEESERRALEGELHILAAAWKDAEEIAEISDALLLPVDVEKLLVDLRNRSE